MTRALARPIVRRVARNLMRALRLIAVLAPAAIPALGAAQTAPQNATQAATQAAPQIAPAYREAQLSAVARLRAEGATDGGCSAVLVAPALALTAAHCTLRGTSHVLIFDPDTPTPLRVPVTGSLRHPEYEQTSPPWVGGYLHDLALLILAHPVPPERATPMPLSPLDAEAEHAIFGFVNRSGAAQALHGSEPCRAYILTEAPVASDCAVENGQSGGGFLRFTPDGPHLTGLTVAQIVRGPLRSLIAPVDPATWPDLARRLESHSGHGTSGD